MSFPMLPSALARALEARGYHALTPVQLAVGEPQTEGRDLLVSARTGSGKTVAYGLALASDLLDGEARLPAAGAPLALVIAPTRELALQVRTELEWLYADAGGQIVSCVGGMDPRRESRALEAGAHIVVGTPGRLRDHIERGQLELSGLKAVVLDEADEMLDLGFQEELDAILAAAPGERRTLLFSATLPKTILSLAKRHQRDALRLKVESSDAQHADIEYRAVAVGPKDAEHALVNLLRYFDPGAALVFCSTREAVRHLHANLNERGFSVVALSGELSQNERSRALQALRDRRAQICVATDVAARGIDIPDLDLVIHAEPPRDVEALHHRSGRTGRAGRKGVAVVLVPHARRRRAEGLFRLAGLDLPLEPPPTADEIRARDQDRLAQSLRPTGDPQEEDLAVARTLLADLSAEVVVASLVRAARAKLPAAEDLMSEPEPARPSRTPRQGFEDTVWFSLDIGRHRNADPKWLLPLICRRGGITKREIGAIRTFERETRFEVVSAAADAFFKASRQDEADGGPIRRLQDPDAPAPQRAARAERTRSGPTSASGPRAPGQAAKKPYPKGKAAPWARKRKP